MSKEHIEVQSTFGKYYVFFDDSLSYAFRESEEGREPIFVVDQQVLKENSWLEEKIGKDCKRIVMDATEDAKEYTSVGTFISTLLKSDIKKDSTIIAIGGGIVQDVVGFAASIIKRGVKWRFIPTTLLSQCDSCIGAKSSINVGTSKNQVGTFWPPTEVHISGEFLQTLPPIAMRSGMGEVAKFHLLAGEKQWEEFRHTSLRPTVHELKKITKKTLEIKKQYIEKDEMDTGIRNLLNYGHCVGHAFEAATGFQIPHGIAVALGICAATYTSARLGMVDVEHYHEVAATLRPIIGDLSGLACSASVDDMIIALKADKKNRHNATYLVLTRGPGQMEKRCVDLQGEIRPLLINFLDELRITT